MTAVFDYGSYVCQFETGVDAIPRFDAHLEVYTQERVLRVQYDTPYVRHLPIRLQMTEANGRGGLAERAELPVWGDAFVAEWQSFYASVVEGQPVKTSPADFRAFIRRAADTIFHPAGTCRMGLDAASVVDPKLRVRGVDALWVMDASVMPATPNSQTFAACLVIAEKGASQF